MSQICYLFRDGNCKFGSNCRFLHDGGVDAGRTETRGSRRKATQICYSLRDNKSCEYGDDCRYSHDLSAAEEAPAKAAPKEKAPTKAKAAPAKSAPKEKAAPAKAAAKTAAPAAETKSAPAAAASESKSGNERLSCFNWRDSGTCEYGDKCHYLHEGSETRGSRRREQQVCYALQNTGSCKFGEGCRFSHDLSAVAKPAAASGAAAPASSDAPATKSPGVCYRFKRSGKCGFGDDCKFVHAAPSN